MVATELVTTGTLQGASNISWITFVPFVHNSNINNHLLPVMTGVNSSVVGGDFNVQDGFHRRRHFELKST